MKRINKSVENMWGNYLKSIGETLENTEKKYTSWCFGYGDQLSNNLADLTMKGIKRATTSLYYWYEKKGEELPKVGEINVVEDGEKVAKCIIEIKKVTIRPFCEVDAKFAYTEGEGDRSLEYWRETHIDFFSKELKLEELKFTEKNLVVCEEFEVIYQN